MTALAQKLQDLTRAQRQIEEAEALQKKLEAELGDNLKFLEGLREEIAGRGMTAEDVAIFLAPHLAPAEASEGKGRKPHKPRAIKIYNNPNTGEIVETKGGNHNTLKAWKAEYGNDVVEGWRVDQA